VLRCGPAGLQWRWRSGLLDAPRRGLGHTPPLRDTTSRRRSATGRTAIPMRRNGSSIRRTRTVGSAVSDFSHTHGQHLSRSGDGGMRRWRPPQREASEGKHQAMASVASLVTRAATRRPSSFSGHRPLWLYFDVLWTHFTPQVPAEPRRCAAPRAAAWCARLRTTTGPL